MKLHDILLTSLETRPLETKSNEKIWKKELDKSKKNEYNKSRWNGSLAQLVEHLTLNQGVRGSNPWWSTRHSAQSHSWLWAFLFLPNSHKIHHFYQCFYQIKKMPFRSAWRDGIFWCSVTGFIIFFVRKEKSICLSSRFDGTTKAHSPPSAACSIQRTSRERVQTRPARCAKEHR